MEAVKRHEMREIGERSRLHSWQRRHQLIRERHYIRDASIGGAGLAAGRCSPSKQPKPRQTGSDLNAPRCTMAICGGSNISSAVHHCF